MNRNIAVFNRNLKVNEKEPWLMHIVRAGIFFTVVYVLILAIHAIS